MARTVNEEKHAQKRNEILNAAQQLIYSKGYERMTIQDILAELQISSGAFYHYFDSKPAVLEAFVQRIKEVTEKPLLPIIRDPQLTAIEKLQGFFDTLDRLRTERRANVVQLMRVWYTDENAIVRQKVDQEVRRQRAPLLAEIVRQGIAEGLFDTPYPDQAGDVIITLILGMGDAHVASLLDDKSDEQSCLEAIIATHAAYMEAIERVLGAPQNALYRAEAEAVQPWMNALGDSS